MAALLASMDPTMDDSACKPPSIRSVASSQSVASAVSLTRRPRARPRSRTVTGASSTSADGASELPYLDSPLVQEPLPMPPSDTSESSEKPPVRPSRSELRLDADAQSSATPSSQNTDLAGVETTLVEPQASMVFAKTPTKASLAPKTSLPAIQTRYQPLPSAFSRDPSHIPNVRDSVSTHQSAASSSLYPLSTSTASAPESPPSPRSMSEQFDHLDAVRIDSEGTGIQEFDGDDVAYRLQLLVKNNYFLPPAHSKPSPSDFAEIAANTTKKSSKSSAPAFLDLFRAVKPKSKPTTPSGSPHFDGPAPMLRATSDSITAPHSARPQPRLSSQLPRASAAHPSRGRVVVVREKMGDIAVAAKQAEQDLKNKGVRLDQIPPPMDQTIFDDVIDPTDAVDIPLPSASYPFAVQASALHGLGVQDSLGADVLADRLPPPKGSNSNMSASFEADNGWRKVLLHQAVHHSLDNTPDVSTFSHMIEASTPVGSRKRSKSAAPTPRLAHRSGGLGGEGFADIEPKPRRSRDKKRPNLPSSSKATGHQPPTPLESRASDYLPPRVGTPSEPLTPLMPPPRHHFAHPMQSFSQTDLSKSTGEQRSHSSASRHSRHTLRRAQSSPMLADPEPLSRALFAMTPPPIPNSSAGSRVVSARTTMSFETVRDHLETGTMSDSIYSDDEYLGARNSMTFSAVMGRPSLSIYSQESMSPTTSAFQMALNHGSIYSSPSPSLHHASNTSLDRNVHATARDSISSPPPRMSSSLAHLAPLPPPPRPAHHPYPQHVVRPPSIGSMAETEPDDTIQFNEPEPTTPPVPSIELRESGHGLSLDIPRRHIPRSIRSAPGPSSPPSFFDSIQTQPNAMDDLESSDESDDDQVDEMQLHPPSLPPFDPRTRTTSTASAPVPRSPIMKFVNHSAPYVGKPSDISRSTLLPFGGSKVGGTAQGTNIVDKQPVGNIPLKPQFFAERKGEVMNTPSSSTYDFYRYTQGNQAPTTSSLAPTASTSRTSIDGRRPSIAASVNSQKAQESLRKLDGMLLQHIETEKDTIKRIATTMKQGGGPPSEGGVPPNQPSSSSVTSRPCDIQN